MLAAPPVQSGIPASLCQDEHVAQEDPVCPAGLPWAFLPVVRSSGVNSPPGVRRSFTVHLPISFEDCGAVHVGQGSSAALWSARSGSVE